MQHLQVFVFDVNIVLPVVRGVALALLSSHLADYLRPHRRLAHGAGDPSNISDVRGRPSFPTLMSTTPLDVAAMTTVEVVWALSTGFRLSRRALDGQFGLVYTNILCRSFRKLLYHLDRLALAHGFPW